MELTDKSIGERILKQLKHYLEDGLLLVLLLIIKCSYNELKLSHPSQEDFFKS